MFCREKHALSLLSICSAWGGSDTYISKYLNPPGPDEYGNFWGACSFLVYVCRRGWEVMDAARC